MSDDKALRIFRDILELLKQNVHHAGGFKDAAEGKCNVTERAGPKHILQTTTIQETIQESVAGINHEAIVHEAHHLTDAIALGDHSDNHCHKGGNNHRGNRRSSS